MNKAKPKALGRRKSLQPMTFRVDFEVSLSQHEGDPSDFITVYQGNIIGMMDDDDERKIGTLVLYMVERGRAMNEGVSLFEVMDCLDGDSCDCFANLFDSETEQLKPGVEHLISENRATQWDIMLIERLELNPECRGRGLGIEIAQRFRIDSGLSISVWPDVVITAWYADESNPLPEPSNLLLSQSQPLWFLVVRTKSGELERNGYAGDDATVFPKFLDGSFAPRFGDTRPHRTLKYFTTA